MARNCSQAGIETKRPFARRMWAALFVVCLFVASWFVSGTAVARAFAAFVPVAALMFAVEFTADSTLKLLARERWCIRRRPARRALSWSSVWIVLLNGFIAVSVLLTLVQVRNPVTTAMSLLRLAAGVAFIYTAAVLVFELSAMLFIVAGFSLPLMHRAPIAARSVGEFWGQRWNMIVSAWFRTFVFRPLARRGFAGVGVLCCFLVSGAFHGWPMLVAQGTFAAVSMMAFFVIQGFAVLAENWLNIHTWPAAIARTWTLGILLVSSPLFIDPALRLFGF